jgi:hypothetical protein
MSRKHYVAIVRLLNDFTRDALIPSTHLEHQKFNQLIEGLADMFQQDNPHFSRQIFFDAVREYDNEL